MRFTTVSSFEVGRLCEDSVAFGQPDTVQIMCWCLLIALRGMRWMLFLVVLAVNRKLLAKCFAKVVNTLKSNSDAQPRGLPVTKRRAVIRTPVL